MLSLFKNQRPATLGLLVFVAFMLWSFSFFGAQNDPAVFSSAPFYRWVINITEFVPFIATVAGVTLIVVEAVMMNNIIIEGKLISTRSYIPSLVYILLMSSTPALLKFQPGLVGNFFFILMLSRLFKTYREEQSFSKIFDAGMYLGLASTVHFSFILMIGFGWATLAILRSFSWRDWVVFTCGVLIPYFFILTYFYAFDELENMADHFVLFEGIRTYRVHDLSYHHLPVAVALGGLAVLAGKTVYLEWRVGVIKVKKLLSILVLFSAFSLALPMLLSGLNISAYAGLAIPLCIYLSNYLVNSRKPIVAEISFLLVFLSIIYLQIVTL